MKSSTVAIGGISIQASFLSVTRARKYVEADGHWVIATKRGTRIATFPTENELDSWWHAFQTGQGRKPRTLAQGKAPARSKNGRIRRGLESKPIGPDYLKPWSKEYDMPEYDLE